MEVIRPSCQVGHIEGHVELQKRKAKEDCINIDKIQSAFRNRKTIFKSEAEIETEKIYGFREVIEIDGSESKQIIAAKSA